MSNLPSTETLAMLVSGVTQTMFGISFTLAGDFDERHPWLHSPPWRAVSLRISGNPALSVAIASDPVGGSALGCAMFSCPPEELDNSMVDDSLRELVNIVAGQIKCSMGIDASLGLPQLLAPGDNSEMWRSATLRRDGEEVMVWVAIRELAA